MIKFTSREPFGFSSRNESCCRWPWREDAQFHSKTAMKPNSTHVQISNGENYMFSYIAACVLLCFD